MPASTANFMYLPGKELTCLCGRVFKTDRGVRQHIRRPAFVDGHDGPDGRVPQPKHGRCWSDQAKFIHQRLLSRTQLAAKVRDALKDPVPMKPIPATLVRYKLTRER